MLQERSITGNMKRRGSTLTLVSLGTGWARKHDFLPLLDPPTRHRAINVLEALQRNSPHIPLRLDSNGRDSDSNHFVNRSMRDGQTKQEISCSTLRRPCALLLRPHAGVHHATDTLTDPQSSRSQVDARVSAVASSRDKQKIRP
jgi:hypothetical protein